MDAGHNRSPEEVSRRYTIYLIIVALAGWSLASYDLNLLVLTIPDIAKELKLSGSLVDSLVFFVSAAQFIVTLFVGYAMDTLGRKRMWMVCLAAAALFTGMTFFVQTFWQLVIIRMLASAFAQSELAVSITLVNEQVTARHRGLLYSAARGVPRLRGVPALYRPGMALRVPVRRHTDHSRPDSRFFIRESDRFRHVQEVKTPTTRAMRRGFARCFGSTTSTSRSSRRLPSSSSSPPGLRAAAAHPAYGGLALLLDLFRRHEPLHHRLHDAGQRHLGVSGQPDPTGLLGHRVLLLRARRALLVTFTTPTAAWLVIAVGLALGQWLTLALRRIPPGQELEEIAT